MRAYGQKKWGSGNGKFAGSPKTSSKKAERRESLDEAIESVFGELSSMDPVEFKKELKKHRNGDIARLLRAAKAVGL
jgi:hypothetical protein